MNTPPPSQFVSSLQLTQEDTTATEQPWDFSDQNPLHSPLSTEDRKVRRSSRYFKDDGEDLFILVRNNENFLLFLLMIFYF